MDLPVFGTPPLGQSCEERQGAYALLLADGHFGAVEDRPGVFFLPGGGVQPGEYLERALRRELAEELGAAVDRLVPAGRAVQYFSAGGRYYRMLAHFFEAQLGEAPVGAGAAEYELQWLPLDQAGRLFHECQRRAVKDLIERGTQLDKS